MRNLKIVLLLAVIALVGGTVSAVSIGDYSDIQNAELDNGSVSISGDSIAGEVTYQVGGDVDVVEVEAMYVENRLLEAEMLNQTEMRGGGFFEKVVYSERIDTPPQNLSLNASVDAVRFVLERNTEDGLSPSLSVVTSFDTDTGDAAQPEGDEEGSFLDSVIGFLSSIIPF